MNNTKNVANSKINLAEEKRKLNNQLLNIDEKKRILNDYYIKIKNLYDNFQLKQTIDYLVEIPDEQLRLEIKNISDKVFLLKDILEDKNLKLGKIPNNYCGLIETYFNFFEKSSKFIEIHRQHIMTKKNSDVDFYRLFRDLEYEFAVALGSLAIFTCDISIALVQQAQNLIEINKGHIWHEFFIHVRIIKHLNKLLHK